MWPATKTLTKPRHPFECLGGPSDGEIKRLEPGVQDWAGRIGGIWHLYRLQPTDLGQMLVYQGAIARHRPAEPAS